jgi:hypothetical protein
MDKIKFIVETTRTGFSAYTASDLINACTTGSDVEDLKLNMVDAINTLQEYNGDPLLTIDDIEIISP